MCFWHEKAVSRGPKKSFRKTIQVASLCVTSVINESSWVSFPVIVSRIFCKVAGAILLKLPSIHRVTNLKINMSWRQQELRPLYITFLWIILKLKNLITDKFLLIDILNYSLTYKSFSFSFCGKKRFPNVELAMKKKNKFYSAMYQTPSFRTFLSI